LHCPVWTLIAVGAQYKLPRTRGDIGYSTHAFDFEGSRTAAAQTQSSFEWKIFPPVKIKRSRTWNSSSNFKSSANAMISCFPSTTKGLALILYFSRLQKWTASFYHTVLGKTFECFSGVQALSYLGVFRACLKFYVCHKTAQFRLTLIKQGR
jgi:hypothetical protein